MFCYQCEQTDRTDSPERPNLLTFGCSASKGNCGKDATTAALQDVLVHVNLGIGQSAHKARELGAPDPQFAAHAIQKTGKAKLLAIASKSRVESLPDVPTFAELGFKGLEDTPFYGIWAPAGRSTRIACASIAASKMAHSSGILPSSGPCRAPLPPARACTCLASSRSTARTAHSST